MLTTAEWLSPVKVSGIAAYFVAAVSCGAAAVKAVNQRISRLAAVLGILHAAVLLDIAFDLRWRLYARLKGQVIEQRWYYERHWPQVSMMAILAAFLLAGVIVARRQFHSPAGAAMALEGSLLSIGCWATEVISLHGIDSILYHHAGPLMVVNFVWMLACLITTIGMLKIVNSVRLKKLTR